MKLVSLFIVLVVGGVAHADDRAPVDPYADDDVVAEDGTPADPFVYDGSPVDPFAAPIDDARLDRVDPLARHDRMRGQRRGRAELRRLLLAHFDRDRDGRLEPRERRAAARALHRLAERMMRGERMHQRRGRALIRRYDLDHDGNVGPGEMPPGLADRLRGRDRNGDGWLRGDELP